MPRKLGRADGSDAWSATWNEYVEGKRVQRSRGPFDTKEEAEALENERRAGANEQPNKIPKKRSAQAMKDEAEDQAEVLRIRGMSDEELLAYVSEVRQLRASSAQLSGKASDNANNIGKAVGIALRKCLVFHKSLKRNRSSWLAPPPEDGLPKRTLSTNVPNVTQAIWDQMFPYAAGKISCEVADPSETFGGSFYKQLRWGALVVTDLKATLKKDGTLRVSGHYELH